ncbi:MAG: GtrA family protein [Clostridia bacterium]|nr:GtrA family protein [Clostridia bacterium]
MGKKENIEINQRRDEKIASLNDGILKDYAVKKIEDDAKKERQQTARQALKYFLFAASAGIIQFVSSTILKAVITNTDTMWFMIEMPVNTFIAETVGLALSVIWNFSFNRKFTFKDASNVPIAMALAFFFYVPFYPFQTWYVPTVEAALIAKGVAEIGAFIVGIGTCMLINFILEFNWQKFVVFRKKKDKKAAEENK